MTTVADVQSRKKHTLRLAGHANRDALSLRLKSVSGPESEGRL